MIRYLPISRPLTDLFPLFFSYFHNDFEVGVQSFDAFSEFGGGGVLLQYFEHQLVVVCVIGFDRVSKNYVGILIMLLLEVEDGF